MSTFTLKLVEECPEDELLAAMLSGRRRWLSGYQTYGWVNEDGLLHHEIYPAIITVRENTYGIGCKMWFLNGNLCRNDDLPSVIEANGTKRWFHCGAEHRDGGHPAVIFPNGYVEWWVNGCYRGKSY